MTNIISAKILSQLRISYEHLFRTNKILSTYSGENIRDLGKMHGIKI